MMSGSRHTVVWIIPLLLASGCRKEESVTDGGTTVGINPPPSFDQRLSFNWTGLPQNRVYTKLRATYDQTNNWTTIETLDEDSTVDGKFLLQLRGGRTGTYQYSVTGSTSDTNQIYIRFIPLYQGSTPVARFELTGSAGDSLEAEVDVTRFAAVRDTIMGSFSALLKRTGPTTSPPVVVLIHAGEFVAQRQQ